MSVSYTHLDVYKRQLQYSRLSTIRLATIQPPYYPAYFWTCVPCSKHKLQHEKHGFSPTRLPALCFVNCVSDVNKCGICLLYTSGKKWTPSPSGLYWWSQLSVLYVILFLPLRYNILYWHCFHLLLSVILICSIKSLLAGSRFSSPNAVSMFEG